MRTQRSSPDLADPAVRAARRLVRERSAARWRRLSAVAVLGVLAVVVPASVQPLTGDPGATTGGVVLGLLLLAIGIVLGPAPWSPAERRHRELDAIWRELRPDADREVAWERCLAWAEPDGAQVDLVLITCAPAQRRVGGAPTPYGHRSVRRVDAEDVDAAAQAMEELRAEAARLEEEAERRVVAARDRAERRERDRALHAVDEAAAADLRAREAELERELAAQEAAERRAQAEAVARALRRP